MSSNYSEVFGALKEKSKKKSKKGTTSSSFSRGDYATLTGAMLNDYDYEAKNVKCRNGEYVVETEKPVAAFREAFIGGVLKSAGVDKADAEKIIRDYNITQRQAETLYPCVSESIYQYMSTGKSFAFESKEDFAGSVKFREVEEHDSENRDPQTGQKVTSHIKAHKSLVKKCGAPKWCRKRLGV